MEKLLNPVGQEGFSFSEPKTTIQQQVDGGASRFRSDLDDASYLVSVKWKVNPTGLETIQEFFSDNEALPFLIDLTIDYHFKQEYTAYFVTDSFSLDTVDGLTFEFSAQLEVMSNDTDTDYDLGLLEIFSSYPDGDFGALNLLAKLVNIDLAAVS